MAERRWEGNVYNAEISNNEDGSITARTIATITEESRHSSRFDLATKIGKERFWYLPKGIIGTAFILGGFVVGWADILSFALTGHTKTGNLPIDILSDIGSFSTGLWINTEASKAHTKGEALEDVSNAIPPFLISPTVTKES